VHCLLRHSSQVFFEKIFPLSNMIRSYPDYTELDGTQTVLNAAFIDAAEKARKKGHNALVVFEDLAALTRRQLQVLAEFLTPNWNVRILVAYRPLYSWLPAWQNEINKNAMLHWTPGFINNRPFDLEDEGSITSIDYHAIEHYRMHTAELVRDKYKEKFHDVQIIPLQLLPEQWSNGGPLLGYIFCQALKSLTPSTCRKVEEGVLDKSLPSNSSSSSSSSSVHYLVLADGAYTKKLLPTDFSRPDIVIPRIQEHQESKNLTASDFPLKCMPPESLDKFERLSLDLERRLFPLYWTVVNDDAHHAGFQKMLANNQHCHLDVEKVLEDESWLRFFEELKTKST
jgi:hypothetical protein